MARQGTRAGSAAASAAAGKEAADATKAAGAAKTGDAAAKKKAAAAVAKASTAAAAAAVKEAAAAAKMAAAATTAAVKETPKGPTAAPIEPAATSKAPKRGAVEALLDDLEGDNADSDLEMMETLPGQTLVHVLKGEDIPAPGDPLGKTVLIGGKHRRVLRAMGTAASGTPFVVHGGEDDDGEDLTASTNPALEAKLREEGLTEIPDNLIELGGRLPADELATCAAKWRTLHEAVIEHDLATKPQEETLFRKMLSRRSRGGTLRNFFNLLDLFPEDLRGAPDSWDALQSLIDTLAMAATAAAKRKKTEEPPRHAGPSAAAAGAGSGLESYVEEAMFTTGDGALLNAAIGYDGAFNELIVGKKHLMALHKASGAKRSRGLEAVIDATALLMSEQCVEITKPMVAAVIKAELTSANALAKMGALTTEVGTHQFDAIADAIMLIGAAAGLGDDVKGLDGVTRALKKELPGVAADKIRAASEDIAALGYRQLG